MAESMKGLHRSHRCAEVVNAAIGSEVTVMGWVQKRRNLGGMIFIDLRDRSGLLQIVFDENDIGTEGYEKAGKLRSEFVIAVTGKLEKRGGAVNDNLATGELEVRAESLRILSESETPPFPIEEHIQTRDELRLKYRYLDLRRPNLQRNLLLRSKVATAIRRFMDAEGFLEIETPILIKSTPEGARDYLVPSRVHPGSFYALPQSPQPPHKRRRQISQIQLLFPQPPHPPQPLLHPQPLLSKRSKRIINKSLDYTTRKIVE